MFVFCLFVVVGVSILLFLTSFLFVCSSWCKLLVVLARFLFVFAFRSCKLLVVLTSFCFVVVVVVVVSLLHARVKPCGFCFLRQTIDTF